MKEETIMEVGWASTNPATAVMGVGACARTGRSAMGEKVVGMMLP